MCEQDTTGKEPSEIQQNKMKDVQKTLAVFSWSDQHGLVRCLMPVRSERSDWLGLHVRLVFGLFDWRLASSTGIPSLLVWASPRTPWIWLTSCRRSGITLERHNIIIYIRTAAIVNDKNLRVAQLSWKKKQQVPAHDYRRRATAVTSEEGRWKIPGKHLDLVLSSVKIKKIYTLGLSDTSDISDTIL